MSDTPSILPSPNNNNNNNLEEDNLEEEDNDNNNDDIANENNHNRESDDVKERNDEENESNGNEITTNANKAFNELLDMVTYIDKATVRQPKREVSWKDFDVVFSALEKNIVGKVLMCEDTSSGNESLYVVIGS